MLQRFTRDTSAVFRGATALTFVLGMACSAENTPLPSGSTGGTSTGGSASGGSATGGFATGGFTTGGFATGGFATGGSVTGGSATGGSATGGFPTGGSAGSAGLGGNTTATGGNSAGGVGAGTGGTSAAGAASGGKSGGTGGTAGGSGGSGGSSTTFEPCPATGVCKILPLGDSITDGIGFAGGYRVELFHKAHTDQKNVTFVGGSMNGPSMVDGVAFPKNHEGHSGWTISQIDGIVPSPALDPSPHIVLLHIGTNDMVQGASGAVDRLGTLIDQIIAKLPNSLLVVSNIIPLPGGASAVSTFNAAVPGVVKTRTDANKHVIFVDQFKDFPTSELGDGVHPNQAGYARMAGVWYTAIRSYLH